MGTVLISLHARTAIGQELSSNAWPRTAGSGLSLSIEHGDICVICR